MKKVGLLMLSMILLFCLSQSLFAGGKQEAPAEAEEAGPSGPVTIEWLVGSWLTQDHPDEQQAWDFEKVFEKEYPDIDLVIQPVGWDGMHDKFLLVAKTNTLPHLMSSEDCLGWTIEAATTGNIMDLTDFVTNDIGKDAWRTSVILDQASWKGKIYSVPYRGATRCLVWNKEFFADAGLNPESPPRTFDQILEYGLKITGDGRYGFSYPLKRFCTVAPEYARCIMDAYGADIIDKDYTKGTINTPQAKEALTFWTDLVTKYKIVPEEIINNDDNNDYMMFSSEVTGICMVGPWTVETFHVTNPDLNYGVATLPSREKGKIGRFGLLSMGNVLRKDMNAAEREASFKVCRMLLRPDVNMWFTDDLPVTPIPKEGMNPISGRKINFLDHPLYKIFLEQVEHVYPSALMHPSGPKIAREVNMALQRIILGQDASMVLDEANEIITELLQDFEG